MLQKLSKNLKVYIFSNPLPFTTVKEYIPIWKQKPRERQLLKSNFQLELIATCTHSSE